MQDSIQDLYWESIGVYGPAPLQASLEKSFGQLPYRFIHHETISSLTEWVNQHRPRMVLFESKSLGDLMSHDGNQSLRERLKEWATISLVMAKTVEEMRKWRESGWPGVQFYYGATNEQTLKHKITNLLAERLFMEKPVAAIYSNKNYLIIHYETLLKNYGIRVVVVSTPFTKGGSALMAAITPDLVLWDVTSWEWSEEEAKRHLIDPAPGERIPSLYLITDSWPAVHKDSPNGVAGYPEIYSLEQSPAMMGRIVQKISERKKMKLNHCRDQKTGLYLPDLFAELVNREMEQARRYEDKFSILRITLGDEEHLEDHFGSIFVRELKHNLGVFIQNRVRSSDTVASGKKGEVLVLLSRVGRDLATLVGERIKHHFTKAASFGDESSSFTPHLVYDIHTFPTDINDVGDVEDIMEWRNEYATAGEQSRQGL